jgi:hemerythrin-like domain-containing protein
MDAMPVVRRPLEFLEGHHDRQLLICAALEHLAEEPRAADAAETARMVLDYFERELPLHIADEEEDLFPLMLTRCEEDDGFEEIVALLESEHETDFDLHDGLIPLLGSLAEGAALESPSLFARDALTFATLQRRHLSWENGAVLPLARQRLNQDDLDAMAVTMTQRRVAKT